MPENGSYGDSSPESIIDAERDEGRSLQREDPGFDEPYGWVDEREAETGWKPEYKPPPAAAEHSEDGWRSPDGGVAVACRCGWVGPARGHELEAEHDLLEHLRAKGAV